MANTIKLIAVIYLLCVINITIISSDKITKTSDKVILIASVLAPPRSSRQIVNETAKEFPVLMLLATDKDNASVNITDIVNDNDPSNVDVAESKTSHEPIYVKKLEDSNVMP